MSACEKCWRDSRVNDDYAKLLNKREAAGLVCTPEEQAGPAAKQCPVCKRMTLHQHSREPVCGCPKDAAGHFVPRVTVSEETSNETIPSYGPGRHGTDRDS